MVVKAVKEVYPEYNWRKGGFINGRKKENKSLTERLLLGEKVLCKRCGKGYYITDAKEAPKGHGFYCNICDDLINLDPIIDIE